MKMISYGIEALGFGKWFQDRVDPVSLNRFDIARVIAVHKDSYTIHKGANDVFAELIEKMSYLEKKQKDKQFGKLIKSVMKQKKNRR